MSLLPARLREVLRDPLYRWELRSYWTWRRYLGSWAFCLGFVALTCVLARLGLRQGWLIGPDHSMSVQEAFVDLGSHFLTLVRLPLLLLATAGATLLIVSERRSGNLEQFCVTSVNPWRFVMARAAGRLRGLLGIWFVAGAVTGGMMLAWAVASIVLPVPAYLFGLAPGWAAPCLGMAASVVRYLDLGLMMVLCTAVGLRFSASSRSTAIALIKSGLVCFIAMPMVLGAPVLALNIAVMFGAFHDSAVYWHLPAVHLVAELSHAGLGGLALWLFVRWARKAADNAFVSLEAGP